MTRRLLGTIAVLVAVVAPEATAQNQPNLLRRVSINVNAVSPRQVMEMIARALDCSVAVDPKVNEPVTLRVTRVTGRTALTAICESIGCQWRLDGRTLRIDVDSSEGSSATPAAEKGTKPRLSEPLPSGELVYLIGRGVKAPTVLKDVRPAYTPNAMSAKIQGQVDVEFVVLRDGTVTQVEVTRPLSPELDQQAVQAVRQWLFSPATLDGRLVAVRCQAQLAFNLR